MPRYVHILFNLLMITLILNMMVGTFYKLLTMRISGEFTMSSPILTLESKREETKVGDGYRVIIDRQLFGAPKTTESSTREEAPVIEDLAPTTLDVKLLGTIAGETEMGRAVIFSNKDKTQGLYRVGDSVQGAVVKKIVRSKVVLRVGERDEVLVMEEMSRPGDGRQSRNDSIAPPSLDPTENKSGLIINRAEIQQNLSDINQLMAQARIRPNYTDGRPDGLLINNIQPGSLYSKLGLQNNDVIRAVNGKAISTPEDVLQFYSRMKNASSINLEITRGEQQKALNYMFSD